MKAAFVVRLVTTFCTILLLAGLPFLLGAGSSYTPASARATTPLGSMLNADGTLNLAAGFRGSLDPKGWRIVDEPGMAPRFVPSSSTSSTSSAPLAAGDQYWDGGFGPAGANGTIYAIAFSNGDLYVGGTFANVGGIPAANIARWNSSGWAALSTGTNGTVSTIAIAANGDVYAGGSFSFVGGVGANRVARWDGSAWS